LLRLGAHPLSRGYSTSRGQVSAIAEVTKVR
jgi:hypothetical protein